MWTSHHLLHCHSKTLQAQRASEKHAVSNLVRFWWDLQNSHILAPLKYFQNYLLIKQNWVLLTAVGKSILTVLAVFTGSQRYNLYELRGSGLRWVSTQGIWMEIGKFLLHIFWLHKGGENLEVSFTIFCIWSNGLLFPTQPGIVQQPGTSLI